MEILPKQCQRTLLFLFCCRKLGSTPNGKMYPFRSHSITLSGGNHALRSSSGFCDRRFSNAKPITTRIAPVCYRLCVCASGSLITDIFNCRTLIRASCLHLGQYNGKFIRMVSSRSRSLVLLLQIGHRSQFSLCTNHTSNPMITTIFCGGLSMPCK